MRTLRCRASETASARPRRLHRRPQPPWHCDATAVPGVRMVESLQPVEDNGQAGPGGTCAIARRRVDRTGQGHIRERRCHGEARSRRGAGAARRLCGSTCPAGAGQGGEIQGGKRRHQSAGLADRRPADDRRRQCPPRDRSRERPERRPPRDGAARHRRDRHCDPADAAVAGRYAAAGRRAGAAPGGDPEHTVQRCAI